MKHDFKKALDRVNYYIEQEENLKGCFANGDPVDKAIREALQNMVEVQEGRAEITFMSTEKGRLNEMIFLLSTAYKKSRDLYPDGRGLALHGAIFAALSMAKCFSELEQKD